MSFIKPTIIAEIGCNHKGDIQIAKELIKVAKTFCKADIVKFQKRNNKELLSNEQYDAPHPNPENSYGKNYGDHREFLEFNLDQFSEIKNYCEKLEIDWSSSVWDLSSAKKISSLKPKLIKVPSACNNNYKMLEWLCENFEGDIHVSTGMTTKKEIEDLVCFFESKKKNENLVLYSCTSGYPVSFKDVCLLEIKYLKDKYYNRIKDIGFSGHHLGIAIDVAAYTLGANWIERHYTLDRTWKGTDHAASLEPEGMRKLVRNLNSVYTSMSYKETEILEVEKFQMMKLKNNKI
jgi:N-acetylneuraminate synthase